MKLKDKHLIDNNIPSRDVFKDHNGLQYDIKGDGDITN